jgi:dipeptidase
MLKVHRRLLVLALLPMALFPDLLPQRIDAAAKASAGCTTIIVGKKATADGSVIMAHNEDYGDNDCMHLAHHPPETHAPGEVIRFAFVTVPQVPHTYAYTAVEMYSGKRLGMPPATFLDGMNEHGLSLASNCIDCREPSKPFNRGLGWPEIGQLVLQRCKTAREAVELCGRLIDQYTFNGFENTECKNLTFLMADANEGWILEATRRHWVAKRCPDDGGIFYANQAQINTEYDLASADLVSYAAAHRWYDPNSGKQFSFKEAYGKGLGKPFSTMREVRARELLAARMGLITVQHLMAVLRDHYEGKADYRIPHRKTPRSICASATQSSQVYHLRGDKPRELGCVMWSLGSSPCSGVYTPIWAGYKGGTPAEWLRGSDSFSTDSAWWAFESIQRILAPSGNSKNAFWDREWPTMRERWSAVEKGRADEVAALESDAMKLWQQGSPAEGCKLLTDYSNSRLHSDFLQACSILDGLKVTKRKTKRD